MEAALKTSSKTEAAPLKLNPQAFLDDLWALNGASCDDFLVDDLLDFSNEDGLAEKHVDQEQDKICISVSPKEENREGKSNQSVNYDFGSVTDSEIGVQADDMESLEWLSHFVEESFSEILPSYHAGIAPENPAMVTGEKDLKAKPPVLTTDMCFKSAFPAKSRSKRSRYGAGAWSLRSPSSLTESSTSSSSSSSSSMPNPNPNPWLLYTNPIYYSLEPFYAKPVLKKLKKKLTGEANGGSGYCAQQPRRCSHCGVQKTPQWRAGPLGVKTLCNACGVRFKSGRLLPEYRPACSPTFSIELHSNHHRKVLEMRKKNETEPGLQEAGLTVPGFDEIRLG